MQIDVDSIIAWLVANWQIPALVVGVIVVLVIVIIVAGHFAAARRRRAGLDADPEFETDGEQARDLAIGLLTIVDNIGIWNDPDAKLIARSEATKKHLREMWGLDSAADWRSNIQRLVTDRRASEPRDTLLAVRAELAERLGRRPGYKEWLGEVSAQGGSARGENRDLIGAITNAEQRMAKQKGVLPADHTIRDVHAFAYSQAVALAVWGVALGFAARQEALEVTRAVSERARSEYPDWQSFGRSVLLGRAMFLGQNAFDTDKFDEIMSGALADYGYATNPDSRNPGPWTYLPW